MEILLTQAGGVFGPISTLLGYIMSGIYMFLDGVLHIQNFTVCIIVFTVVIYCAQLPLTIKQQKFSKLTQSLQPELQAIQKKYKGKKDQASMLAMQEENKAVYEKYGTSQMGSCLPALLQFAILVPLYSVVRNIPAYVPKVKEQFQPVVNGIMDTSGYQDIMNKFVTGINLKPNPLKFGEKFTEIQTSNSIIDVLSKLTDNSWNSLTDTFSALGGEIHKLQNTFDHMNNFFGLSITETPMNLIKSGWSKGAYFAVAVAILLPLISCATQFINMKLMPTPDNSGSDTMASSMKTMNYMMPLITLFMGFSFPIGLVIYWTVGGIVRCVQQFVINKHIDKIGMEELIRQSREKAKKKKKNKKTSFLDQQMLNAARMNTRSISEKANVGQDNGKEDTEQEVKSNLNNNSSSKPGSMFAKANMVKDYNERNSKK